MHRFLPRSLATFFAFALLLTGLDALLVIGCGAGRLFAGGGVSPELTLSGGTVLPNRTLTTTLVLDHDIGDDALGWAYGVCHDPAILEIEDVGFGSDGEALVAASPSAFFEITIEEGGWGLGFVIDIAGGLSLPPGTAEIGDATYRGVAAGTTTLCNCDTIGSPPIITVIVYSGASVAPIQNCGTVTVPDGPYFIRGDANVDGLLDLGDGIAILNSIIPIPLVPLFLVCRESADANSDGNLDLGDPIFIFSYLFIGGAAPAAPFPECGAVPGVDCSVGQFSCP